MTGFFEGKRENILQIFWALDSNRYKSGEIVIVGAPVVKTIILEYKRTRENVFHKF